jgi:intracellular sulfur oxidation DsrE/DsrF family protein
VNPQLPSSSERRSFLTRFNAGAAALAALAAGGIAKAQEKAPAAPFQPARHAQDDWMDQIPGKHRMVIDTTSEAGFRDALLFAGNFMDVNRSEYGLQNQDLAVIIVARHLSTAYAYNSDMWAKYGPSFAERARSGDDQAKAPPKMNPNTGMLISLSNQGVHFAVCAVATRAVAGMAARAAGGTADAVNTELIANLVPNGRIVPAGIVAVSRAQERGYTVVKA